MPEVRCKRGGLTYTMRIKVLLAVMCLSVALCTQAFSGEPQSSGCRNVHFRGWLKAVFTVQCKTCIFRQNPPAPEPAPQDTPKDAPKTDAAPVQPAPAVQPGNH